LTGTKFLPAARHNEKAREEAIQSSDESRKTTNRQLESGHGKLE